MYKLTQQLTTKLLGLNHKQLEKGEIFLLAKSIADSLPLAQQDVDNINLYLLTHKRFIGEVLFCLDEYSYLDEEKKNAVFQLINELTVWRFNIAYNPPSVLFKGDPNTVIDDISCLLRYVNVTHMCSVSDIADKANYVYGMFRELVAEVKSNYKEN